MKKYHLFFTLILTMHLHSHAQPLLSLNDHSTYEYTSSTTSNVSLDNTYDSSVTESIEEYNRRRFKLYLGIGYANPEGGIGVIADIEPTYRVNDRIAVGFRYEVASLSKCRECDLSNERSYTINAKYYFKSTNKLKAYAGIGLGFFKLSEADYISGGPHGAKTELGLYPRIGFDAGRFNLNIDINIVNNSVYERDFPGLPDAIIKNDFLSIRFGFFMFGGKK